MRGVTLGHLIDYEVDPRNREWFARSRINHTFAFPAARYDLLRTMLVTAAGVSFLPFSLLVAIIVSGVALAGGQVRFERISANEKRPAEFRLKQFRILLLVKAVYWAAVFSTCIWLSTEALRVPIAMIAMLAIMSEALKLIAVPRTGMAVAAIQALALAGTFFALGGGANIIAGIFLVMSLNCIHWGLFNLHYLFATRRLRTRELKEKNETVQLLLNQYDEEGSDWLFETDNEGNFINPSVRFCEAAGFSRRELEGMRFSSLMEDSPQRNEWRETVYSGKALRGCVIPMNIRGKRRWWSLSVRPVTNAVGERIGWRGFAADVTSAHEAEERVAYMAHYDALTGLPNRNLFGQSLDQALLRRNDPTEVCVIHVDLDNFKAINDTHGHAVGDDVLVEAARRIAAAVPPDAIIARLGGDEFAVILESVRDPEIAMRTARAIVAALKKPIEIEGHQLPLGGCAGLALSPRDGASGSEVVLAADLALHEAKAEGRRRAFMFQPEMKQRALDRRELEQDLRGALVRGELEVHYQPLLNAASGKTVGYEALLRWKHPVRGSISPTQFIPIAEETAQIIPIGAWVLREALMEASTWPEDIFISINLSPVQMKDPRLVSTIFMALSASGVAPSRVELEITETVLLSDSEENLDTLHKIRDLGVKIALDDFGTGYSSLSYLRSFPFDKIKIDRCFVTDLAEKADSQAIVTAVIKLAEELGMCTLAEGVENMEQLDRLRQTGCEQVQGFLFSRARPGSELKHFLGKPPGGARAHRATVTPFKKGEPDAAEPARQGSVQARVPGGNRAAG